MLLPGQTFGDARGTPLCGLLEDLDAIRVRCETERGGHVGRTQHNPATVAAARCDSAQPALGILLQTEENATAYGLFQVVNGR